MKKITDKELVSRLSELEQEIPTQLRQDINSSLDLLFKTRGACFLMTLSQVRLISSREHPSPGRKRHPCPKPHVYLNAELRKDGRCRYDEVDIKAEREVSKVKDPDWAVNYRKKLILGRKLNKKVGEQPEKIYFAEYFQFEQEELFGKLKAALDSGTINFLEKEQAVDEFHSTYLLAGLKRREKDRNFGVEKTNPPGPAPFPKETLAGLQKYHTHLNRAKNLMSRAAEYASLRMEKKYRRIKAQMVSIERPLPLREFKDPFGSTFWFSGVDSYVSLAELYLPHYPSFSKLQNA